jgi:hypothetical protein
MLGVPGLTRIIKAATLELGPKGPWKVRLAAIKSEVLRIVKPEFCASCDNLMSFCGANATTGYLDNWVANQRDCG